MKVAVYCTGITLKKCRRNVAETRRKILANDAGDIVFKVGNIVNWIYAVVL
jgi:hypothetical protein